MFPIKILKITKNKLNANLYMLTLTQVIIVNLIISKLGLKTKFSFDNEVVLNFWKILELLKKIFIKSNIRFYLNMF